MCPRPRRVSLDQAQPGRGDRQLGPGQVDDELRAVGREDVLADEDGRPVLVSEHKFPAHRTEFVVDLPSAEPSISPSGLRLVE